MRIGTWNLAGRWDSRHLDFIGSMAVDLLLLTEVSDRVDVPGLRKHTTESLMSPRRHWAAILATTPLTPLPDPHGATAMAEVAGLRVCSSVLPWRSCGTRDPWVGTTTAAKTVHAVEAITAARPTVWGGDWNHALSGPEYAGSVAGRSRILEAVDELGLQVATAASPHHLDGLLSIDHVAVPLALAVRAVEHVSAVVDGARISDHDAYVVVLDGQAG